MRFVHIADLHLGMSFKTASFGKEFGNKKRAGIMKNFNKVVEYIKNEKIELLLIAGDFIEGDHIEIKDLYDINYLFSKIPDTKILLMTGNHDPQSQGGNPYQLINWVDNMELIPTRYCVKELEDYDLSVISVSWDSKGPMKLDKVKLEEQVKCCQGKYRILMLHGDAYNENDYMYLDTGYLETLKVDYIALGHIHKPDRLKSMIGYPGSLEPLDFSESYSHGFIIGEIEERGKVTFNQIESMINPMEILEIDVTGINARLNLIDKIEESITAQTSKMIRVVLRGELSPYIGESVFALEKDIKEIYKLQLAYIEIKDKTIPAYDLELLYEEHKEDLIGYFIRRMKEKGLEDEVNRQALASGITLLLETMG